MNAITLDQFAIFMTIIEEGSFAAAARKLCRAQSAITYAIQKLEDQSGVILFDRSHYRPTLTDAGRTLLPRIRRIMDDFGEFRLQAHGMSQGVEAELNLVVDHFLPMSLITPSLERFYAAFPMVPLRINAIWTQDAQRLVVEGGADLGVFIRMPGFPSELENKVVADIDLVAVAAPDHPLAKLPANISPDAMRDHLQIVVSHPKLTRDTHSYGIIGANQWSVSEVRLRYSLIMAGIGWGSMPRPMIEAEVARGELVILHPAQWDASNRMPCLTALIAKRKDKAMGPAATFLMNDISSGISLNL